MSSDVQTYSLGDWKLKNGGKIQRCSRSFQLLTCSKGTIPDAHIAYKTFGDPKKPAIIYPSWYVRQSRFLNTILRARMLQQLQYDFRREEQNKH